MKKLLIIFFLIGISSFFLTCYTPPAPKRLPSTSSHLQTLFIALDGIDYQLMAELKKEGYFKSFNHPIPLISTFPSATTIGFTGLFQPLGIHKVPGYEVRFYSKKQNKIIGGTPFDIYKIPIKYKYFFDAFRHQMHEKAMMYSFPGVAGRQDLQNTEKVIMNSTKNVVFTYLGGTDGSAHILGRKRTKHFLKFMDSYLQKLQNRYFKQHKKPLRIVMFSDHGFYTARMRNIKINKMKSSLKSNGFNLTTKIKNKNDIVTVQFGLLSGGVLFTKSKDRKKIASIISKTKGMDLVFWKNDSNKKIYITNSRDEIAYFEYKSKSTYRYKTLTGDPLNYLATLKKHKHNENQWLSEKTWQKLTYNLRYPDAGFRLYGAFFDLVENSANIMFSTKENYQYGSLSAKIGTYLRFGHKGTHGSLLQEASYAFAMSNQLFEEPSSVKSLRYNEFFNHYIPEVVKKIKKSKKHGLKHIEVVTPMQRH